MHDKQIYESMFLKNFGKKLINEDPAPPAPAPVNATPPAEGGAPSDADVWAQSNPKIKEKGLEGAYNVEGIPQEVRDQYTTKIDSWKEEVNHMSDTLDQIYDFATRTAEKAGADKIFAETSDIVEDLLTTVGTLQGKLKFLSKKVMVAIDRDNKKQRGI
jgi:hypothetical protein